jgi:hypothetical protein
MVPTGRVQGNLVFGEVTGTRPPVSSQIGINNITEMGQFIFYKRAKAITVRILDPTCARTEDSFGSHA